MAKGKINYGKASSVLSKAFVENHTSIAQDEAEHLIARAEQKIKALKEEQLNDEKLQAAQQIVKDLKSGYSSVVKLERAKIDFLLGKIQEIEDGSVNPSSSLNN